jgi:hypothetical protein
MTASKIPDEAFEFYVGLGPGRSYEAVAAHYDVSKNGVAKKAARDNWTERLLRIERDVQDRMDKKIADSIEDMRERHLKAAKAMMGRAIKGMQEFPLTSGMEAIRAAELAIKLERLIAGESSERTEVSVTEAIKRETQRWLVPKEEV